MLVPVIILLSGATAIVPETWNVLERRPIANVWPSYCQYGPFWSSNVPARTIAPVHVLTTIKLGPARSVVVAPSVCVASTVSVLSSTILATVYEPS